jgi:sugar lactone lactonase YvrE
MPLSGCVRTAALGLALALLTPAGGEAAGSGPRLVCPNGIVVEPSGTLVVADCQGVLFRIDPVTGDRTIISGNGIGAGPESAATLIVGDTCLQCFCISGCCVDAFQALVRVDAATGDRTLLSEDGWLNRSAGRGPRFKKVADVAREAHGTLVVTGKDTVFRVDAATGARRVVTGPRRGSGPPLVDVLAIAVQGDGSLFVADRAAPFFEGTVIRVDPVSGNRTLVSGPSRGSGPSIAIPEGLAVEADGSLVLVDSYDRGDRFAAVIRIDPVTGDRTVVSQGP